MTDIRYGGGILLNIPVILRLSVIIVFFYSVDFMSFVIQFCIEHTALRGELRTYRCK